MVSTEERMRILQMIDDGKITAEEGARLLAALSEAPKVKPRRSLRDAAGGARWLRIRVQDTTNDRRKV